jgi:hypothetical protein
MEPVMSLGIQVDIDWVDKPKDRKRGTSCSLGSN